MHSISDNSELDLIVILMCLYSTISSWRRYSWSAWPAQVSLLRSFSLGQLSLFIRDSSSLSNTEISSLDRSLRARDRELSLWLSPMHTPQLARSSIRSTKAVSWSASWRWLASLQRQLEYFMGSTRESLSTMDLSILWQVTSWQALNWLLRTQ